MAENAKNPADDAVEQKDLTEQEQKNQPEKTNAPTDDENEVVEAEVAGEETKNEVDEARASEDSAAGADESDDAPTDEEPKSDNVDKIEEAADKDKASVEISIELPEDKKGDREETEGFQESVREQIENCKFEIISSLQDSVHNELKVVAEKQVRKIERRRRCGVIVRDIIILVLAAIVGYFGYCLYDAKYFDFMKSECERTGNCQVASNQDSEQEKEPELIKDTAWYQQNFGYLYDSLKINLNADKVSAYYLYSDDYKVSEIQPNYLLAMAYNRLNSNITYDSDKGIMIPADDLRNSFVNLFGSAEYFTKKNFTYDCADFTYDKESDSFITPSIQCNSTSNRQIIEEIDEIFEDGNALYFLTTATIYDKSEESFYSFDNLFKPVAEGVTREDFSKNKGLLNKYQYKFKKVDDKHYFSDVVKLK